MWSIAGTLTVQPATDRTDLLAAPVVKALGALEPQAQARCGVAAIDPNLPTPQRSARRTARRWTLPPTVSSSPASAAVSCGTRRAWCWPPHAPT
jgi:hypothetical protein